MMRIYVVFRAKHDIGGRYYGDELLSVHSSEGSARIRVQSLEDNFPHDYNTYFYSSRALEP